MRQTHCAGPAYWIFLPAILLSGFALWKSQAEPQGFFVLLALSALLPSLLGLSLRAMHEFTGASICAVIVIAWYWLPVLLLMFVMNMGGRAGGLALIVYLWMFILPTAGFALAATLSFARSVGVRWASSAVIAALIPSVFLVGAAEKRQRSKYTAPRAADPMTLGADLLALHKCNQDFSISHPVKGYADSLDQLGPVGTQCLAADLVRGTSKDFTIRYAPGPRSIDGKLDRYTVSAWETAPKATDWTTIYSDESGLIWYRFEGPTGPTRGWLESFYPGSDFATVLRCIEEPDPTHVRVYQGNELLKITDRNDYIRNCVTRASFGSTNTFSLDGYQYWYSFSTSKIEISARPVSYGVNGLRSFLAVENLGADGRMSTLSVYATPQNRAATTVDPLAMADEVGLPLSTGVAREASCENHLCP